MRIAICDKAALVRDALATFLSARGHLVVSCVGADADIVSVVRDERPDALLLDAALAGPGQLQQLRTAMPVRETRVVLLTHRPDEAVRSALAAGLVHDAVPRSSELTVLERALSGTRTGVVPRQREAPPSRRRPQPRPDEVLTPREREVVELMLRGSSTTRMAEELGICSSTVHTHVQGVLRKLGASSRVQAVSMYLAGGSRLPMRSALLEQAAR